MTRSIIWTCAKVLAALIMARAGYTAGIALAICCLADHGDVGSAAASLITSPLGMITGALLGWFVVRLFERRFAS
jgi:hypothetical protein